MTTGPRGEVESDGEGRRLVLHRYYPDPVDEVWRALTDSERLGRWFGTYTGRGGPGGSVELTVTGEVDAGGEVAAPVTVRVLECDEPWRLVVDIPEGDRSWRIVMGLTEEPGGTAMRFEQLHLPEEMDPADLEAGWRWYLDRLTASLHDEPMPAWEHYTGPA